MQSVAGDLLETVRKTESSLKRLKKNRAAGDAATPEAAGGASDTDKMTTQLFLDVQVPCCADLQYCLPFDAFSF